MTSWQSPSERQLWSLFPSHPPQLPFGQDRHCLLLSIWDIWPACGYQGQRFNPFCRREPAHVSWIRL